MNTKPESKPPEGTPTPSTVSLPSYQEWYLFYLQRCPPLDDDRAAVAWAKTWAEVTVQFLAQRGSPR